MAESSISAPCGTNVGGLVRLVLYRAKEVVSIAGGIIELIPDALAFGIVFVDGGADYQESLKQSDNGPFTEVSVSASFGQDSADLVSWCNLNNRRKFIADLTDGNGNRRITGSQNYPLTLNYGTLSGKQPGDKNDRFISLTGRQLDGGIMISPVEETYPEPGSFLLTENYQEFIVTETGNKIFIQ